MVTSVQIIITEICNYKWAVLLSDIDGQATDPETLGAPVFCQNINILVC